MKKILIYFASLIIGLSTFISCEDLNEPIVLNDSDKFVAFNSATTLIQEESTQKIGILVYIASVSGSGCTVNFDFDTTGIEVPALEDIDFTLLNDSKTLTFNNYYGYDTIWIETIDNLDYTTNKSIKIVLLSATNNVNLGAMSTNTLTLIDNEHPLGKLIGSYTVSGTDEYWGDPYSETVTVSAISETELEMNIWNGFGVPNKIFATVDIATSTITFPSYQNFGNWNYGDVHFGSHDGSFVPSQSIPVTAVYDIDGDFTLLNWGGYFWSGTNEGLWWQAYYSTTWVKQ